MWETWGRPCGVGAHRPTIQNGEGEGGGDDENRRWEEGVGRVQAGGRMVEKKEGALLLYLKSSRFTTASTPPSCCV